MKKDNKVSDEEIIKELQQTDENNNVEDIFEPNGKMKVQSSEMTEPTTSAKRKTLLISIALIAIVVIVSALFNNSKTSSEEEVVDSTNPNAVVTESFDTSSDLTAINEEIIASPYDFVSNNGHLYNLVNNSVITSKGNDVLYLYKSDIDPSAESTKSFDLFLSEETKNGYTLTDLENNKYEFTEEEYASILSKYSDPQNITYPNIGSADYNEFSFMSAMDMNKQGIQTDFVNTRYLAVNGNYGVIICSPKGIDNDLHGYIFERINNEWEIIVPDYQNIDNYINYVNTNYGYMDINLLLNMDINKYPKDSFITDLDPVVNGMLAANIITEADLPMTYGVGLDNLMYMEFTSGLAFVGVADTNGVTTYPVVNTYETKTIFEKFSDDPPYIILKQY